MIDLIKETKGRLEYNQKLLQDTKDFIASTNTENLSKECLKGLNDDIEKFNRNIEYYEVIIKVLEDKK